MIASMTSKQEKEAKSTIEADQFPVKHDLVLGLNYISHQTIAILTRALIGSDPFCVRQFDDPKYSGTRIHFDKVEFEKRINEIYLERDRHLVEGYVFLYLRRLCITERL